MEVRERERERGRRCAYVWIGGRPIQLRSEAFVVKGSVVLDGLDGCCSLFTGIHDVESDVCGFSDIKRVQSNANVTEAEFGLCSVAVKMK